MKMCVLGAGSVGLGVAASLIKAGGQVTLIARGESLRNLQAKGIRVTGVLGEHECSPQDFAVADTIDADCDLIIVATKAYEAAPALGALVPALKNRPQPPAILLLQNGWGVADEVKQIMPPGTPLFSASVMTGFERVTPAHVKIHAHADAVRVGSLFSEDAAKIRPLFDLSARAFIPFAHEPDIEPVLLAKLLYNICLNPLGAILRCTYGELLTDESALALMERITGEALKVLAAARSFTRYASGKDYVRGELIPRWLPKVAAHRSSMLQDIEAGRRTEILYLNGAVSALGRSSRIETPCNDTIVELVRGAEDIRKKARAEKDGAVAWRKQG